MRVVRVYHAGRDTAHRERDRALVRAGVDLTLVVPRTWPGADELDAEPFDVLEVDVRRPGDVNRHTFADPDALAAMIRALAPDVVDLHEEPFSSVVHQLLHRLPDDLPVVTYAAQNIDKRFPPPFAQWEQRALARIDGIYPCSKQAASVVVGKGFTGAVEVLPLAPASAFSRGRGRQELPAEPARLLLVGRLVPEKGVLDAVRAVAALARSWPLRLTLVGEGPDESAARGLAAQLGIALDVLPWSSAETLAHQYRCAHILLAPSRTTATWVEQYGRMVTEAQASGAVVVAYDSGALPEVVGDAGVLVPTGDTAALSGAIALLLSEPERWRALRAAGLAVSSRITWDEVAAGQLGIYERAGQPRTHLPVRPRRHEATRRYGPPAQVLGVDRPFALPVLRDRAELARPLAAAIDRLGRAERPDAEASGVDGPLRVVYLDHVARMSGGEVALVRLVRALPGVDAHVILGEDGPLRAALEAAGASVEVLELDARTRDLHRHEIGRVRAVATTAAHTVRLARRLRELSPDLVHTNSMKSGYYGSLAARLAGIPVVWHLRDRVSPDYLPGPVVRLTRSLLATLPDLVLCNSVETARTAGRSARVAVVHDPYAPTLPPRTDQSRCTTIGIVGRLAEWKGQDVFLRALVELRGTHPQIRGRVVGSAMFGEDEHEARLRALVDELGLGDAVTFTGFVDDVEAQLAELDVLVHASTVAEPFGQVVVEAMAAGVPVIATDGGGPAEIITDSVDGLLVRAGDVAALVAALQRLVDDPHLRGVLATAGVHRAGDFAPARIASRVHDAYRALVRPRTVGGRPVRR